MSSHHHPAGTYAYRIRWAFNAKRCGVPDASVSLSQLAGARVFPGESPASSIPGVTVRRPS